jgi:hypothetical protein
MEGNKMADVATLGLAVDSRPVVTANDNLDRLGRTAAKTERSTEGFERSAKRAGTATDRMARDVAKADKAMMAMRGAVVAAAGAFVAFASATFTLQKFVSASIEAQKVQAQLAAALASTKGASGQTVASLNAHAAALQKITTYGDETINTAQGLLLTFTKIQGDTFPKATVAVLNVATAMNGDLKSAAIQVGKSLNDPVAGMTALSRSGITFTEGQKAAVKQMVETNNILGAQNLILKELEVQFGGSAEALRGTLGGALSAVSNAWGDLFEKTAPQSNALRLSIEGLVNALSSDGFKSFIGAIGGALLAAMAAATMAANVLVSGLSILGDNLDLIGVMAGTAGSLMLIAFGPAVFSAMVSGFVTMGAAGVAAISAITAAIAANPLGALAVGITAAVGAIYFFRDEIQKAIGIDVVEIAKRAANYLIGSFVAAYEDIKLVWSNFGNIMGAAVIGGVNIAIDAINTMINAAKDGINSLIRAINQIPGVDIGLMESSGSTVGRIKNEFSDALAGAIGDRNAAVNAALNADYIGAIGAAFEGATPAVKDFSGALDEAAAAGGGVGTASGKAAKDTKKALKDVEADAEKAAKALEQTLGSTLASLFDGPIKSADEFFDKLTSGFAGLAQQNIAKLFEGTFSGGITAANDNFAPNTTFAEFIGASVEKGAQVGTANGALSGLFQGFTSLFGDGQQQGAGGQGAGGGALGAGLGGFSLGYQSQNPMMGALGGFLSGLSTGNPIFAAVGSAGGRIGSIPFSERKAA